MCHFIDFKRKVHVFMSVILLMALYFYLSKTLMFGLMYIWKKIYILNLGEVQWYSIPLLRIQIYTNISFKIDPDKAQQSILEQSKTRWK